MTRCHPCVQGIGQALYEGVHYDGETGQLLTGSLLDYAIPRADVLPPIRSHLQGTPSPTNPLGVKGIGESGTIGTPPTIVHALLDALVPFGRSSRHAGDAGEDLGGDSGGAAVPAIRALDFRFARYASTAWP